MPRPVKLDPSEIRNRLAGVPGWEPADDRLCRTFEFDDFIAAFGFMASMALVSEARNHHPNWSNVYKRVVVELQTHDAGGITELDFAWAEAANRIFARRAGRQ